MLCVYLFFKAPKSMSDLSGFKAKQPKTLQYKETVTLSYEECIVAFTPLAKRRFLDWKHSVEAINEDSLCTAKIQGEGCCIGDSGSPLVANNTLIGVVSWSASCSEGFPDIYTNVLQHIRWINDEIAAFQSDSD